ncbi:MFS transporter [Microdochium trichocladiopsis]|uniref:MFS transporter n=1 Tax=Microdochium trichocladiopsis TaxID=1682393 RepID=A0A9P8XRG6_9PEZI|nr:MFS transporter [Microdochium trichocladiopsis]KAH7014120.1 MFS transporter [Microdochium trichocladiopsis]
MASPGGHNTLASFEGTTPTVNTVHQDEALKILSGWTGEQTWEPSEEKAIVRRLDRTLLVLLTLTYGLQYYDKAMLSQAALFGLRTDLALNVGERYSFSAAIFYLGFICGATPAVLLSQRFPIERVCAGIVLVWGVCLMTTAACRDWRDLYVQRFFLGFLESGVSPMFMLVVGGWYKRNEQALRMGVWYSATGYVSVIAPLINYGLGHISGGLSPWKYMYLVAGSITVAWSAVIYFFLPPDPIRARGLTDRERYIAVARLRVNNTGVRNTHFKWQQALEVGRDIRFWLVFGCAFLAMIANGPVSSFIPIFISNFGFSTLNSLLLTMPAGAVIGTIQLLASYCAYRFKNARTWIIAICQVGTVMSALLLWLLPRGSKGGLLFGCYFLASFGGGYAVLMGLQVANTAGYTKRSVASSGIFIGYCLGNFVGPLLFKTEDAPGYGPGFLATVVTAVVVALLIIVYRFVCIWENRRRDRRGIGEGFDNAYEDDLTDMKNPQFRYTL